jgi:F-type H+-transporting ATPase subunit a
VEAHYTYLTPFIESPEWQKFTVASGLGLILVLLGVLLTRRLKSPAGMDSAIIPAKKCTTFGFFDLAIELWIKFQDSILGKENRKYLPFTASVFFFLLFSNLLGLVPGMPAVTTTVWINVGMAIVVFAVFNMEGVKANGLWNYIKHFMGPVWWLIWLIFPLEILSTLLRVLTLNLRLYWNISADHIVLGIFHDLTITNWLPLPVIFYAMGTFVAFMQAFVFSLLSMVYILLATQHEEGHHEEDAAHGHHAGDSHHVEQTGAAAH